MLCSCYVLILLLIDLLPDLFLEFQGVGYEADPSSVEVCYKVLIDSEFLSSLLNLFHWSSFHKTSAKYCFDQVFVRVSTAHPASHDQFDCLTPNSIQVKKSVLLLLFICMCTSIILCSLTRTRLSFTRTWNDPPKWQQYYWVRKWNDCDYCRGRRIQLCSCNFSNKCWWCYFGHRHSQSWKWVCFGFETVGCCERSQVHVQPWGTWVWL